MLNKVLILCIIILGFKENTFSNTLDKAVEAYDNGYYQQSIDIYEHWLQNGPQNGHVLYNLGNSYYRLGLKGKAMASFLGARKHLPRDPDVKANLAFVHQHISDNLDYKETKGATQIFTFWVNSSTSKEILNIFVVFWALGISFLVIYVWKRDLTYLKSFAGTFLSISAIFIIAFFISHNKSTTWGAVTSKIAQVRSGPAKGNTLVFELHEGAPFIVKKAQNNWYLIKLSDGKTGWISKKEALAYGI